MSSIEIKNFSKSYSNKKVIENLNLNIKSGSFFTLLGPSGCGKTTLLKSIVGIIDDYSGEILIDGKNINSTSIENRNITFVFQDHLLFPNMTVFDNVAFGLTIRKLDKINLLEKVTRILELLEITELKDKYPHQLSGGQKQRVSIGRALAINPKILLMDEPFSSLDINLRYTMRSLIKKLHKSLNLTIVFVTHDKDEALILSDEIAIMDKGRILQVDSPYNIYETPKTLEVANFFGHNNIITGIVKSNLFINEDFDIKLKLSSSYIENQKYCLALKPEDIVLIPDSLSSLVIKDKVYIGEKFIYSVAGYNGVPINIISTKHIDLALNTKVSIALNFKEIPNLFEIPSVNY